MHPELGASWREARGPAAHVHLDSAACSRTSVAVRTAVAEHLDLEASIGGYVAEAAVAVQLAQLRTDLGALTGFDAEDISLSTGAADPMAQLLLALRPGSAGLLRSDYQRTVGVLAHLGCPRSWLPVDGAGVLDLDALPGWLARERPGVVLLCAVASHIGLVQPVADAAALCTAAGVPSVVDAAQAVGHVDLSALACDAVVGTSRKWLAGPRGVGFLCVRPTLSLTTVPPWLRPEEWPGVSPRVSREPLESTVAGRVGLAHAVRQLVDAGPQAVRERLVWLGDLTRRTLAGAGGWAVVEPLGTPSAITTLRPPDGVDVARTRARLIDEHGILTTALEPERALADARGLPALRVSPHVDATAEELERLAAAL